MLGHPILPHFPPLEPPVGHEGQCPRLPPAQPQPAPAGGTKRTVSSALPPLGIGAPQTSLLLLGPPLPSFGGYGVAARFLPAAVEVGMEMGSLETWTGASPCPLLCDLE